MFKSYYLFAVLALLAGSASAQSNYNYNQELNNPPNNERFNDGNDQPLNQQEINFNNREQQQQQEESNEEYLPTKPQLRGQGRAAQKFNQIPQQQFMRKESPVMQPASPTAQNVAEQAKPQPALISAKVQQKQPIQDNTGAQKKQPIQEKPKTTVEKKNTGAQNKLPTVEVAKPAEKKHVAQNKLPKVTGSKPIVKMQNTETQQQIKVEIAKPVAKKQHAVPQKKIPKAEATKSSIKKQNTDAPATPKVPKVDANIYSKQTKLSVKSSSAKSSGPSALLIVFLCVGVIAVVIGSVVAIRMWKRTDDIQTPACDLEDVVTPGSKRNVQIF